MGGLLLGLVLAVVVQVLDPYPAIRLALVLVNVAIAVFLSTPRFAPMAGVGLRWQVPRGRRLRRYGWYGTFGIWGALLGVGALTVIPSSMVLLFPAVALAAHSGVATVLGGVVYGAMRAVVAVIAASRTATTPESILDGYERLQRRLVSVTAAATLPAGLGVILLALFNSSLGFS